MQKNSQTFKTALLFVATITATPHAVKPDITAKQAATYVATAAGSIILGSIIQVGVDGYQTDTRTLASGEEISKEQPTISPLTNAIYAMSAWKNYAQKINELKQLCSPQPSKAAPPGQSLTVGEFLGSNKTFWATQVAALALAYSFFSSDTPLRPNAAAAAAAAVPIPQPVTWLRKRDAAALRLRMLWNKIYQNPITTAGGIASAIAAYGLYTHPIATVAALGTSAAAYVSVASVPAQALLPQPVAAVAQPPAGVVLPVLPVAPNQPPQQVPPPPAGIPIPPLGIPPAHHAAPPPIHAAPPPIHAAPPPRLKLTAQQRLAALQTAAAHEAVV